MKYTHTPQYQWTPSSWGPLLLAATDQGLCGMWFESQKHSPDTSGWRMQGHPTTAQALLQLEQYFAGQRTTFDLPLDLTAGTEFQQQVWQALLRIPSGQTSSYGAVAALLGNTAAVRAVGAAVGRNPVSIIVPCHRVVGATGALTGYAGGLERKTALLQLENALPQQLL
jgi:methylated-DNA-[protein]-cysteine S-methyltransferase